VNPQEKQADDGPLANQLSISVLLRIAGSKRGLPGSGGYKYRIEEDISCPKDSLFQSVIVNLSVLNDS
jgi:hypothetical protein